MKGIIGKKLGMTQVYDETGVLIPVTVIEAGPCPVVAVKTIERDGYVAQQLGFGTRKVKNVTKPQLGHLKAAGLDGTPPSVLREVRVDEVPAEQGQGAVLKADLFAKGEFVDVSGISKGRGFQGVVKRWNFGGGRASHGGGWTRRPGSIGMCVSPGKVYKGRKMPGQTGNVQRTVQNLEVVEVRVDDDVLFVKGAIPGPNGGTVMVRSAIKK
ncbi:MAG: 50S ribosomal protein L3 [Victivallales bacterium]|jgi:large subunit ribosomal protein L3|nr:50S ribosomal protein L3 [Victivallales bacterium]MBT7303012.1 50S ribosomal protein L3 [Victivallales bacterium]